LCIEGLGDALGRDEGAWADEFMDAQKQELTIQAQAKAQFLTGTCE
jgi:hypothetical protein